MRWSVNRKESVVRLVKSGDISFEDACQENGFSKEELGTLIIRYNQFGKRGLATTKIQKLRA